MPWEKQFNVDGALEEAMKAFWRKGYAATSMQDLVNCMGINRGSLYATFGDKRSLFIKAFRRYEAMYTAWFDKLAAESSPKEAILAVFKSIIDATLNDPDYNGCFLVNTALELAPHDAEIGRLVNEGILVTQAFFQRMIEKGQAAGEIPPTLDPLEAGRVLGSLLAGMRVMSRGRPERVVMEAILHQAEKILR